MNEKIKNLEHDEYDRTSILLCLLKVKLYWFDMDIVEGSPDIMDEDETLASIGIKPNCLSHKMLAHLFESQLCAKVIVETFYSSSPTEPDLDTSELFEWMDALICLEAYSKVDRLVKQHYEDLLKIKQFIAEMWKKSAEDVLISVNDDNIPEWV